MNSQNAALPTYFPTEYTPPEDPILDSLLAEAEKYEHSNQIDKAFQLYDKAILHNSSSPIAYFKRAEINFARTQYHSSMEDLKRILLLVPQSVPALSFMGLCYFKLGKVSQALQRFDEVLYVDNRFIPAYLDRADLYFSIGDFNTAYTNYKDALRIKATSPRGWIGLAKISIIRGNLEVAKKGFLNAEKYIKEQLDGWERSQKVGRPFEILKHLLDTYDGLAVVAQLENDRNAQIHWLDNGLETAEKMNLFPVKLLVLKASFFLEKKKIEEAREICEIVQSKADKRDESYYMVYLVSGQVAKEEKNYKQAIQDLKTFIELDDKQHRNMLAAQKDIGNMDDQTLVAERTKQRNELEAIINDCKRLCS